MSLLSRNTERLTEKLNGLNEKLNKPFTTIENFEELVLKIDEAKEELKRVELSDKVEAINKRETKKRALLKKVVALGVLPREVFTDSMQLHKGKRKQAPELYQFVEDNNYTNFSIGYDGIVKIRVEGFEFYEGKKDYSSATSRREENIILPFESFEDACNCNRTQLKSLTVKQVTKQIEAIKKATLKLEEQAKAYDKAKKANNSYFLENENFFSQRNANIHTLFTSF